MADDATQPEGSAYHLVLTGDGISIDRRLDAATALAVVELAIGGPRDWAPASTAPRQVKGRGKSKVSKSSGTSRKASRRPGSPSVVRDLSLHPKGKQAFGEFVEEKQPKNHFARQAVAVYWLAKIVGMQEGITVDHVNTCYVGAKWKRPAQFEANLQLTAARKGWIDTSDGSDIRITVPGEDFVVHDLPAGAD